MKFEIYEGNCIDNMSSMQPESVDCVIVDPPYSGFDLTASTSAEYWDNFEPYYTKMASLCKADKRVAISIYQSSRVFFFEKMQATIAIELDNCFADKRGEGVIFCMKNPLIEVKETGEFVCPPAEAWQENIISKSTHPNARNINAMSVLVKSMSRKGDTVLDPFCGSGAIGVALYFIGQKLYWHGINAGSCGRCAGTS